MLAVHSVITDSHSQPPAIDSLCSRSPTRSMRQRLNTQHTHVKRYSHRSAPNDAPLFRTRCALRRQWCLRAQHRTQSEIHYALSHIAHRPISSYPLPQLTVVFLRARAACLEEQLCAALRIVHQHRAAAAAGWCTCGTGATRAARNAAHVHLKVVRQVFNLRTPV